jgi:UDP-GlcNAc:undecaprenyl-phosphate/decaprenyl-phosphate GlcNAc-1-phosphate transferase
MQLIFGLVLTLLATPALIWAAHRYNLLDHPDERKQHTGAIPLVGGLAMSLAIGVSAAWYLADSNIFWGLLVSVSIIVAVGFLDDWSYLSVRVRFLAQGIAATIMALYAGAQLSSLGDLFGLGTVYLGVLAVPFTVFAVVGMANALNLSDGLDGLAGGLALIATIFVAVAAYLSGRIITLSTMLILGGALIGFLFFNMRLPWQRRARVFMGDSGSLMLGFLLAWAVIRVTQAENNPLSPAAALWFFAIPLMDTVSLMLRRMRKGKSPFHPGRDHLHHILLRVGYTDSQVVRFIHLLAVAFALVGFLGWRLGVPDAVLFYGFLAIFTLYCYGVRHAWKLMRLIVPLHQHRHSETH